MLYTTPAPPHATQVMSLVRIVPTQYRCYKLLLRGLQLRCALGLTKGLAPIVLCVFLRVLLCAVRVVMI